MLYAGYVQDAGIHLRGVMSHTRTSHGICCVQGALSNYGYRWGWFGIGCVFQVLIVAGLILTGAAR